MFLDGPATFLDIVYETIEAHISRTGSEYEQVITGVDAVDAGNVDWDEEALLHLYVPAAEPLDDVLDLIDRALDRIADEHDMDGARQRVQVSFEDEENQEEVS